MIILYESEISMYKVNKETFFYYMNEYQGLGEYSRKTDSGSVTLKLLR